MAFVSSLSSTNEVNTAYGVSTANTQVSFASTQVNTASTQISTANLSDDTVYAFFASQPNGSQLVYEDLEQIHEDDIEEMDLKWQLALLSMRTRRWDTLQGNAEDLGTKIAKTGIKTALEGLYMADNEVPANMALIAFLDSEVHNDKTCSKTCLKSFETIKTQLDDLRIEFNKSEFNLDTYKRGLASIEEQLVFYKKNEGYFHPPNLDLSYSGLEEFQQPEFEGYGPKTSKSVSEDISNEVRESPNSPLIKELVLDDK
ncbi:hypothetical protein Tco_1542263 [Tanacetum coccineum]